MKDILTKKRVKVDYLLIISLLGMQDSFLNYLNKRHKAISVQRSALAFLRVNKVDIADCYYNYISKGFTTYEDYQKELIRIAQDHSCYED